MTNSHSKSQIENDMDPIKILGAFSINVVCH